ncbi:uncharacterized protein LOC124534872 [Vanessa cardui]|uniref:uncharacterized protein LOC124534872 n=1 Tax=Vanessa cardui TaxID=171605 RepID=UPI001F13061F|nr:uncharacterized protein LOC124534872 [Vanessa cardui]
MGSVQEEKPAESAAKTHVRELRNTELVSRLLAATPPYLYSALPLQPHAFFFSEMLRSFVNARHGCRPPHYHRRFKRRSHKYFAENETEWRRDWTKQEEDKKEPEMRPEVPLELTVDKQPRSCDQSPRRLSPKTEVPKSSSPGPPGRQSTFVDVGTEELPKPAPCAVRNPVETNAVPQSNLILPPPPPMWYPPLYNPQFGVDPLNFFIDLRVSGHIYDRKRTISEAIDPNSVSEVRNDEPNLEKRLGKDFAQKPRHLSAFSVPVRSNHSQSDGPDKFFERSNRFLGKPNGTSYIMRNLKSVYENLHSIDRKEDVKDKNEETKGESSDLEEDIMD